MDEIELRLARVTGRLQARRDQARQLFETCPELSDLREIKAAFNGVVEYVATDEWTWGRDIRGAPCAPYTRPLGKGRGKAAAMRRREANDLP